MVPQWAVMTAGEVMFSITGLQFAFSQAPESMRAVLQAAYTVTTGIGNIIDVTVMLALEGVLSRVSIYIITVTIFRGFQFFKKKSYSRLIFSFCLALSIIHPSNFHSNHI